jgi:hypothetical protein
MAKIIHCDLVFAKATSWSYWTSMYIERGKLQFLHPSGIQADTVQWSRFYLNYLFCQ